MNNIVIGQYVHGTSWIYKLDPRIKISALVILLVTTFLLSNLMLMSIMFGLMIIMIISTRVPFLKMIRGMKPLIFLLTFTFFIQIFSIQEGNILLSQTMYIGPLSVLAMLVLLSVYFVVKRVIKFRIILFFLVVFLLFFIELYELRVYFKQFFLFQNSSNGTPLNIINREQKNRFGIT